MAMSTKTMFFAILLILVLLPQAHAFGAGNIASISAIEGKNWRHGDIEDMLKTIAFIKHHKWTGMMIKRVYFGNWLRDYSQAMDVGTLKKTQAETIRILVWVLSFLSFGYATAEFEVTSERLGVYRPEEHIDNPKDYADNEDARKYDPRLRGPVRQIELDIDPETGMKNYIANERGDWATSAGFVKYSFTRSIHHGRLYTNGHGFHKGKDEDLAEALRCLGQGLHTLEDFGAHTNYTELALREMGYNSVFPHVGTSTQINLRGHHVFPLVTGTFGMVDFFHSVLGEASDHFTQSEVNEMDNALGTAQQASKSDSPCATLVKLLSKMPGTKDLCAEAEQLQHASQAQARANETGGGQNQWGYQGGSRGLDNQPQGGYDDYGSSRAPGDWNQGANFQQSGWQQPPHDYNQPPPQWDQSQQWQQPPQQWDSSQQWQQQPPPQQHWDQSQPSWQQPPPQQSQHVNQPPPQQPPQFAPPPTFDPAKTIAQIYPILAFRDKVVRTISSIIEKIPGLEALVDKITETLTIFILSLLAPFIRPIINVVSKQLQSGSGGVVEASGKHQYEPWTNPQCTDPTHSLLSKDHFSNILNPPAGAVAAEILKYVAPRVLYAWQNPDVPVDRVLNEVMCVFHHPAIRDPHIEVHRTMFDTVKRWIDSRKDRGASLNTVLSAESVRAGKNQTGTQEHAGHSHNQFDFAGMGMPAHQQPQAQAQSHAGGGSGGWQQQVQHYTEPFLGHGGQHGGQQSHGGSQGPLGQFGNLPIPGLSDVNKKLNKYSKFIPGGLGGGSHRGLDDDSPVPEGQQQGLQPGTTESYGGQGGRSPSPGPPAPPSGYEQYGEHSGAAYQGGYSGGDYYGQGGYGQGGYGQGGQGGAAGDYYR